MYDLNGYVGRGGRFGFAEKEVKHRTASIDPNGLRIFELTVMPLRGLPCSRQALALWFRAERRAAGDEDRAKQHDQQRERDTRPEQRARCAAAEVLHCLFVNPRQTAAILFPSTSRT